MNTKILFNFIFAIQIHLFKWIFVVAILMFSSNLSAKETLKELKHTISLKTQFSQIKDQINYGLVFSGLNLGGSYSLEKATQNYLFIYTPEINSGINFNKGIGLAFSFTPVDLFIGRNLSIKKSRPFVFGAYTSVDYNWQLYPELQSGHMNWFTTIEFGPQIIFYLPIKKRDFKIMISNSLAGFTSRPQQETESYFYSLRFSDFVSNAHSNFQFGTYNIFNHTNIVVELLPDQKSFSMAYEFEYFGYFKAPKLSYINHSLNFNWELGNNDFQ